MGLDAVPGRCCRSRPQHQVGGRRQAAAHTPLSSREDNPSSNSHRCGTSSSLRNVPGPPRHAVHQCTQADVADMVGLLCDLHSTQLLAKPPADVAEQQRHPGAGVVRVVRRDNLLVSCNGQQQPTFLGQVKLAELHSARPALVWSARVRMCTRTPAWPARTRTRSPSRCPSLPQTRRQMNRQMQRQSDAETQQERMSQSNLPRSSCGPC